MAKEKAQRVNKDRSEERPAKSSRKEEKNTAQAKEEPPKSEQQKEEAPAGPKDFSKWELQPEEFVITVTLAGTAILGLDVDWADGRTLFIKDIRPGVVKEWNREHRPEEAVRSGDRVLAVNEVADDPEAMLGECRNRGKLNLLIRGQFDRTKLRTPPKVNESSKPPAVPEEVLITLDTMSQSLGIDVDWADGETLYIRAVQPGAIENWNRGRPADQAVTPGCTLVSVNGFSGDSQVMVQQCRAQRRLNLIVRGPPMPPTTPAPAASRIDTKHSSPQKDAREKKDKKKDKEKENRR